MRKLFFQLARSLGTWLRFCEAVQKVQIWEVSEVDTFSSADGS